MSAEQLNNQISTESRLPYYGPQNSEPNTVSDTKCSDDKGLANTNRGFNGSGFCPLYGDYVWIQDGACTQGLCVKNTAYVTSKHTNPIINFSYNPRSRNGVNNFFF